MKTVSVEWGYELHSIDISDIDWKRVQEGEKLILTLTGYYEGEAFELEWDFNGLSGDNLVVNYGGDDGAQGFIGGINDALMSG